MDDDTIHDGLMIEELRADGQRRWAIDERVDDWESAREQEIA